MQVIIFQQGSGSRVTALHYWNTIPTFYDKPLPNEKESEKHIQSSKYARIAYNHLERMPWLYDQLKNHEIFHLYRDPARTFIRTMTKYDDKAYTKDDLKQHLNYVEFMRDKVNNNFNNVKIIHYEDIIRDFYTGKVRELNHL